MRLIQITEDNLSKYKSEMKLAGLCFAKSTTLYKIMVENQMVGFTGMIWYSHKIRHKNSFIFEEFRRKGYYAESKIIVEQMAHLRGIKILEGTATKMSRQWYLNNGYEITKEYAEYTTLTKRL
tara:strand:- start:3297 stop:3665 length:369 start_codon:yes stop_codon:yes gene_type:complete